MIKPGDPRFYEKERNEKIVALRRQGLELKAIAERYGIGVSRVLKIIQSAETEARKGEHPDAHNRAEDVVRW